MYDCFCMELACGYFFIVGGYSHIWSNARLSCLWPFRFRPFLTIPFRFDYCNRRLPITICSGKSCTAGRPAGRPAGRAKPVTLCHAIKKWLLECSRRSKNSVLSVEEYTEHDFTCFRSIFCKKSENFWNFRKILEF